MNHLAHTQKNTTNGFTLVELMVTVAVLVVLMSIGIPSFQTIFGQNRAAASANEILASLQFARSEAVRLGTAVQLCPSTDAATCTGGSDWTGGWIVHIDNEVRRIGPALHSSVSASGADSLTYGSAGQIEGARAPFALSVATGAGIHRCILVDASGRAQIDRGECV